VTLAWPGGATVTEGPALPAGEYRVARGDARGPVVVNASREWIPRRPAAAARRGSAAAPAGARRALRDAWWTYLAVVVLLCAEWLVRRRAGMR
jgi:hypothetical protein